MNIKYFAHRINTIQCVYNYFHAWDIRSIEIDIQTTKDGHIVVYHDDISDKKFSELPDNVPTFEAFLRYIPSNMEINVEIKNYPNTEIDIGEIVNLCEKYSQHTYYFSSFDHDIYIALDAKYKSGWHLQDTISAYRVDVEHICIHKNMLPFIIPGKHKTIGVYDVKAGKEAKELSTLYPFVSAWILDIDENEKH